MVVTFGRHLTLLDRLCRKGFVMKTYNCRKVLIKDFEYHIIVNPHVVLLYFHQEKWDIQNNILDTALPCRAAASTLVLYNAQNRNCFHSLSERIWKY